MFARLNKVNCRGYCKNRSAHSTALELMLFSEMEGFMTKPWKAAKTKRSHS